MALLSAILGWYVVNSQAVDREPHAVYSIQSMCGGGYVAVRNVDDKDGWLCGTGLAGVAEMKWRGPGWLRQPLERINAPILYRIQSIYLADTHVGDAIIEPLGRMKCLSEIDLSRTRITENGLQRIKKMFPRAQVTYDPPRERSAETVSVDGPFN
jgi:hypothetical protein